MKLDKRKPTPETHPVGTKLTIHTIDNMKIKGEIKEYTSDAVIIRTDRTLAKLHPYEIDFSF